MTGFMVFGPWLYWRATKYAMGRGTCLPLLAYPAGVVAGRALWPYCVSLPLRVTNYWSLDGIDRVKWYAGLGSQALFMWIVPSVLAWIIAVCMRLHRNYRCKGSKGTC